MLKAVHSSSQTRRSVALRNTDARSAVSPLRKRVFCDDIGSRPVMLCNAFHSMRMNLCIIRFCRFTARSQPEIGINGRRGLVCNYSAGDCAIFVSTYSASGCCATFRAYPLTQHSRSSLSYTTTGCVCRVKVVPRRKKRPDAPKMKRCHSCSLGIALGKWECTASVLGMN